MALEPPAILAALAAIIGLGYLGSLIFARTRIPDILLLIGLGVVLGPVLGVLPPETIRAIAPVIGVFTLLVILFDGGLSLKFGDLLHGLARASLLAVAGWMLTVAAIAGALALFFGWDLLTAVLLGAILGGSSSIVVIPLVTALGAPERARVTLSVESALTDVLCVVGTIAVIDVILAGTVDLAASVRDVAARFSVALVIGSAAGAAWDLLWRVLSRGAYAYMVTLAAVLLLYVGVEALHASGPIAVLTFGIMLGNERAILRRRASGAWETSGPMRAFQGEITFFIRAFFFVSLGILLDLDIVTDARFLVVAGVILGAILAARAGAVAVATTGSAALASERRLLFLMLPRGLAAAALAGFPAQAGVTGTDDFVGYAFALIVLTNVLVTVGMLFLPRGDGDTVAAARAAAGKEGPIPMEAVGRGRRRGGRRGAA